MINSKFILLKNGEKWEKVIFDKYVADKHVMITLYFSQYNYPGAIVIFNFYSHYFDCSCKKWFVCFLFFFLIQLFSQIATLNFSNLE